MSQFLEGPTIPNSGLQAKQVDSNFAVDQQGFDILKVLLRWKWLPIIGTIVGTLLGVLVFTKMPAQYQATALVQVIETRPQVTGNFQTFDPAGMMQPINRNDESLVIRSETVLKLAIEQAIDAKTPGIVRLQERLFADLESPPSLQAKIDNIVMLLRASKQLVIQPADKDAKTTLVRISYVCNDPQEASEIVNSIVDAYRGYLQDEFEDVGEKLQVEIRDAETRLQKKIADLQEESDKSRATAPDDILWSGNDPTDPYFETYVMAKGQLAELELIRSGLISSLEQVKTGLENGRPPEALLAFLSGADFKDLSEPRFFSSRPVEIQPEPSIRTDTASARLEQNELFKLMSKEKELVDSLGESHPTLSTLRTRIASLKEQIAIMKESERIEQQEIERIRAEAAKVRASELLTGGITPEEQLKIQTIALQEKLAALELQEKILLDIANKNLANSQVARAFIDKHKLQMVELESVQQLFATVGEKVKAMELLPPAGQRKLKLLDSAGEAGLYYGPTLPPYILVGAALGFVLMTGIAVLMDFADRSYRSPDEIAADFGIPVLGHIPIIDTQKVKKVVESVDPSLTTIHHSRGRASEAFRSVRTGLFFSSRGSELKVIQVTSPVPGDGKSTLSSNLAVTMAQSGRRVLLIDADFRRPRIAKIFGIETNVGMAQVVAGRAELDDATYTSCVANLSIMPGGKRPSNPAELLSSNRFRELLDVLREKYDMIIIDTPPLLAVSEPSAVAAIVDGVVLTMRLRRNVKPLAARAGRVLEAVDARLLGIVVNGVAGEAGYGYTYGYNDYRYAYRYGGNYRYGYKYGSKYGYGGYGGKYGSYSAGYLEDNPETVDVSEPEKQNG